MKAACGVLLSVCALGPVGCAAEVAGPEPATVQFHARVADCPRVTDLMVLPLEVIVGGEIEVSAVVEPEDAQLEWQASSGRFDDPQETSTVYFCEHGGEQRLSVRARDEGCPNARDVVVTCSYSPWCGDGRIDFGEECDDGNVIPDDGCSTSCRIALIEGVQ